MKQYFFISLFLISSLSVFSQKDIPFEKKYFKDSLYELETAKQKISKADLMFNNERYADAIPLFQEAQDFNPNNSELNFKLGICHYNMNKNNAALSFFEKSYQLNPKLDPLQIFYLARTNHITHNFLKAKVLYNQFLESQANNSEFTDHEIFEKYIEETENGLEIQETENKKIAIQNLGININETGTESSFYVTDNDSLMFFTSERNSNYGQNADDDIYFSEKIDTIWMPAQNIGKPINTSDHDAVVGMVNNGKTLFIYSTANEGDIYFSELDSINKWTDPMMITDKVNTNYPEFSVCLSANADSMFFLSSRPESFGEADVFLTVKKAGEWSDAIHLDQNINTKYNEGSIFFRNDTLFFGSEGHNTIGAYDLFFSIKQPTGWTKAQNMGMPINSASDDLFYAATQENRYYVSSREGGFGASDIYLIKNIEPQNTDTLPVAFEIIKSAPKIIKIRDILFDLNKYNAPKYKPMLDTLANFLKTEPKARVAIYGYTDKQGNKLYNKELSKKRADFVSEYLFSKGVNPMAFLAEGKGFEKQIAKNTTKSGNFIWNALKYNRRVEIVVLSQGEKTNLIVENIYVPEEYKEESDNPLNYAIWLTSFEHQKPLSDFNIGNIKEKQATDSTYDYYLDGFKSEKEAENKLCEISKLYPNAFIYIQEIAPTNFLILD